MLINKDPLKHWLSHFYGYGSFSSRIWFVAHEDGGGDLPEDVAQRLNYFRDTHPAAEPTLIDIRELYKKVSARVNGPRAELFDTLFDYRFNTKAIQHGLWKNLIAFQHGYRDKKLPDLLKYQKTTFVSPTTANEAIILLYPLPSPHNHAWYYSWLDMPEFPFLKSRAGYQDQLYQSRINGVMSSIITHKPELVLMYGMENINGLKQSVQEFFENVKFRMLKGTKLQFPQHHRADLPGTTLLITTQVPALRHNRIETGFDWYEFGKKVKQEK